MKLITTKKFSTCIVTAYVWLFSIFAFLSANTKSARSRTFLLPWLADAAHTVKQGNSCVRQTTKLFVNASGKIFSRKKLLTQHGATGSRGTRFVNGWCCVTRSVVTWYTKHWPMDKLTLCKGKCMVRPLHSAYTALNVTHTLCYVTILDFIIPITFNKSINHIFSKLVLFPPILV